MALVRLPGLVVSLLIVGAGSVSAQPLGTFRWQQLPYCNVLTVRVVQAGSVFQLDGVDDQCGAGTQASVVGLAFQNPNGSIGLGLTIVTSPGGTPLHIDATVALPGASGTWRDSAGNTGAFAITPGAAVPGSPRPVPKATFPGGISSGGTPITDVGSPVAGTDAANKGYVDAATQTVRAAMVGEKVWKVWVLPNGAKGGTGPYTSSRSAIGSYSVTIDVAGLGFPGAFPLVAATAFNGGAINATVTSLSYQQGVMIRASFLTSNAAGTATDSNFFAYFSLPDADTGSLVPPLALDESRVTCTLIDGKRTCTYTPE
jgi:hypothetical protein